MKEDDFFAEPQFEKYLLEGEKIVWSGGARPRLQAADWWPSVWLAIAGIPPFLFTFVAVSAPHGVATQPGLIAAGITIWLWSKAMLRPIRMMQHLQSTRYAITNQRALIVGGVAYRHSYPLVKDPVEFRAVSLGNLDQRLGPDENGTLTLGIVGIVRRWRHEQRCIGFYACDEVEGAELEILRLLGKLPPAEDRDFDEGLPEPSPSALGLAMANYRRNNML